MILWPKFIATFLSRRRRNRARSTSTRAATVYWRAGQCYLHSQSLTTDGLWVAHAPFLTVGGEDVVGLGCAIQECLSASGDAGNRPKSIERLLQPMLQLAGVKSYMRFAKSSRCVGVTTTDNNSVSLSPTRNGGSREGFCHLSHKTLTVGNTAEALGMAAVEALAQSE